MLRTLRELQTMPFPQRLNAFRKQRALTQQALADTVGIHVTQLRRYEAGTAQPTLDVLRRLALALRVASDDLVFDTDERGPDDDLKLQFEALKLLDPDEKLVVKAVLESILIKHDAKRWMAASG